jgi:hypothetical protein
MNLNGECVDFIVSSLLSLSHADHLPLESKHLLLSFLYGLSQSSALPLGLLSLGLSLAAQLSQTVAVLTGLASGSGNNRLRGEVSIASIGFITASSSKGAAFGRGAEAATFT